MPEYKLEWRYIIYGSGEMVQFEGDPVEVYEGEIPMWEYQIYPNDYIIERYALKRGQEISLETDLITMRYPKSNAQSLPVCGGSEFILIELDFEGKHTTHSERWRQKNDTINMLRKRNDFLNAANDELIHKMGTLTTRYGKFIKDTTRFASLAKQESKEEDSKQQPRI